MQAGQTGKESQAGQEREEPQEGQEDKEPREEQTDKGPQAGEADKESPEVWPPEEELVAEERESIWSVPRRLLRWYIGIFLVEYLIFLGLTIWDEVVNNTGDGVVANILAVQRGMGDNLLHIAGSAYAIVEVYMLADWLREITEKKEREKAAKERAAEPVAAAAERGRAAAERGRAEAERARADAERGRAEAERARADAEKDRADAERSRTETLAWYQQVKDQLPPGTPPPPGINPDSNGLDGNGAESSQNAGG